MVAADKAAGSRHCYVFDNWLHKSLTEFFNFMTNACGLPSFHLHTQCDKKTAEERYKKKNETEEVGEDVIAELEESSKKADK